jgi:plasmid stabilization system protein ParE
MARRITWSLEAKAERKMIFDYWNKRTHSKAHSKKLHTEINKTIEVLEAFPEIGMPTSNPKVRCFAIGNYLLFYASMPAQFRILRLWDGRETPSRQPFLRS